jgi:hypothetical protein
MLLTRCEYVPLIICKVTDCRIFKGSGNVLTLSVVYIRTLKGNSNRSKRSSRINEDQIKVGKCLILIISEFFIAPCCI